MTVEHTRSGTPVPEHPGACGCQYLSSWGFGGLGGSNTLMSNSFSQRIADFYNDAYEASRLATGWFQLEHARTRELILRYLPPAPGTIVDAG